MQALRGDVDPSTNAPHQHGRPAQRDEQGDAAYGVMAPETRSIPPGRPVAPPQRGDVQVQHRDDEAHEVEHSR